MRTSYFFILKLLDIEKNNSFIDHNHFQHLNKIN